MASPLSAPVSTSDQLTPLRIAEASVPLEMASSVVEVSVWVAESVIVGASLTAVTLIELVALLAEKAVVVPELATLTYLARELVEAVPLVWSQALKVKVAVSAFWVFGV
jgi:hypothetical protein